MKRISCSESESQGPGVTLALDPPPQMKRDGMGRPEPSLPGSFPLASLRWKMKGRKGQGKPPGELRGEHNTMEMGKTMKGTNRKLSQDVNCTGRGNETHWAPSARPSHWNTWPRCHQPGWTPGPEGVALHAPRRGARSNRASSCRPCGEDLVGFMQKQLGSELGSREHPLHDCCFPASPAATRWLWEPR